MPTPTLKELVNEALSAISADTETLDSEVSALHDLIHAVAEAGGLSPEAFRMATYNALSYELNADPEDRAVLSEDATALDAFTESVPR